MREYATPLTVDAAALPGVVEGNLTDDVVRNAAEHPEAPALCRRVGDEWVDVGCAELLAQVRAVAKGLVAAGLEPGDRVALMSRTRYEWTVLDYAIWFAGAVTVPVYETSSVEQVEHILSDAGVRAVVVETPDHVARVSRCRGRLPELHQLWAIEPREGAGAVDLLTRLGADVDDAELEERRTAAGPADVATIIYTSGTTGRPKGCVLTHGNLAFEAAVTGSELEPLFGAQDASTLLFLPLAHVFARAIQVGCMRHRVRMGHTADIKHLTDDLAGFRPSFVLAVPRVFEKVFNTASQRAVADGRGRVFARAADVAIAYSRGEQAGKVPRGVRLQHALFDRLVYGRLRAALGGRCEYAVSGGAPLGERLGHFYRGIGITVLEGYGLTETSAALTVNLPDALKIGTVGRPLPGTEVRVAEDGELLFRGGQVFTGYWHDAEATAEVLDAPTEGTELAAGPEGPGWFHTGDVGEIDDEGFVRITGRKKEILVTAGGKNVSPTVLEDRLRAHPLVDQCVVVGDGRPFIAALVTIDRESYALWAQQHDKPADVVAALDDPDLQAEIQAGVDEANQAVSRAESIRKFAIVAEEWSEEGGQLTPSLKLRRTEVMRQAHEDVEALYRS
ncbi:long-chain fatty acid--CoA ligase [Nocardioides mangrovicus]|uniref:Acyl-CoA synthetase n=1 Tax=Nocardioides mangrovicus TaxID=2478913 RepID=A0A3L8P1X7_9ACTN|nr:AMP-dependent synthetase/ligase [Nocardioides mangrovicus]RLV49154.1 long-chain fatty acid--CoA ligase [Nocardioides mangrovicus]